MERRGLANDLLVHAVLASDVDTHGDGLVGLVRHHDALPHARLAALALGRGGGLGAGLAAALLAGAGAPAATRGGPRAAAFGALCGAVVRAALGARLALVARALELAALLGRQWLLGLALVCVG